MKCPECGEEKHRVIKTWKNVTGAIKRVRRCQVCGYPWTTTEKQDLLEKINGT